MSLAPDGHQQIQLLQTHKKVELHALAVETGEDRRVGGKL